MSNERDETRITIRFPRQVADAIKQVAVAHNRSINSAVVHAVREHRARQRRKRDV